MDPNDAPGAPAEAPHDPRVNYTATCCKSCGGDGDFQLAFPYDADGPVICGRCNGSGQEPPFSGWRRLGVLALAGAAWAAIIWLLTALVWGK